MLFVTDTIFAISSFFASSKHLFLLPLKTCYSLIAYHAAPAFSPQENDVRATFLSSSLLLFFSSALLLFCSSSLLLLHPRARKSRGSGEPVGTVNRCSLSTRFACQVRPFFSPAMIQETRNCKKPKEQGWHRKNTFFSHSKKRPF